MSEPSIALVFSPEPWVESLHRHLADHGGARVRQIVVDPSVALDEEYDAIVVSDRWPALTRGFVSALHARRRAVLGVFDPDEPSGKEHLISLGADATIAADAAATEFVAALGRLSARLDAPTPGICSTVPEFARDELVGPSAADRPALTVVSGARGAGVTETATALATIVAAAGAVALVDLHERAPGVAPRLGLSLEPNVNDAVDAVEFGSGDVSHSLVRIPARHAFDVLGGFPSRAAAGHAPPRAVVDVVQALGRSHSCVVVDADTTGVPPIAGAVLAACTAVVGVGTSGPVGITRLLDWAGEVRTIAPRAALHVVVNRAPRDAFRRDELRREILRTVPATSLAFAPTDPLVDEASWDGRPLERGPFVAALRPLATLLVDNMTASRTGRRIRLRRRSR
jgi:MinD-like ATPase involved in chromosome partitioning or flagellar assembly